LTGVVYRLAAVALSADGRMLLTSAHEGALTLWDGRDGKRLRTLAHGGSRVQSLLLAPDGSRALVLPNIGAMPLWWDVAKGRRLPAFSGIPKGATCVAFSPDSAVLALGSYDGVVHLYETRNGREVRPLQAKEDAEVVSKLAYAPDGRTLAVSHTDGNLILWDLQTGQPRRLLLDSRLKRLWKLLFSPDSRLLIVVGEDHLLHVFETLSGQEVRQLRIDPFELGSLAFAPDNRTVAVGDAQPTVGVLVPENAIHLWDLPTGKQIHILRGHQREIHTLAFSANGASLVSVSDDTTVLCWDTTLLTHRHRVSKELSAACSIELWTDLDATDAARAQRAVAELIQAPDTALPFLEKSLPPVPRAKMTRIASLIADLDHEEFIRRDKASTELNKIGELAAPALRAALRAKPSLEMRRRIEALLEPIEARPLSPEGLRTIRALQVLETIGTPQARRILERLAKGAAGARLTVDAKASLQRLAQHSGNP